MIQLKGIGAKRAEAFRAEGIFDTEDLLSFLPRTYLDYTRVTPVLALKQGENAVVRVRTETEPKLMRFHGITVVSVRTQDETGTLQAKWFNQPYRRKQLTVGESVYLAGRADVKKGRTLLNPSVSDTLPGYIPVYRTIKGLTQRTMRDAVVGAIQASLHSGIPETLPVWIRQKYDLCGLAEAYRDAHFPAEETALARAIRRLSFESALSYLLAVESQRAERKRWYGIAYSCNGAKEQLCQKLPFLLTTAQERVISEIQSDLEQPYPMNRLLQGDVGSGKTVVAAYALLVAVQNGYQGALLAPTEILAQQHYEVFTEWFGDSVCLLTGAMNQKARAAALSKIADGSAHIVIGTHALLQQEVHFARLGVVVTDEQHRFGVMQRAEMASKGVRPDVLVMSATPIPRTLALILYGDLEVSILDELPPGRLPVKTSYISRDKRQDMYHYIEQQAACGCQTFAVCPVIEDSEAIEAVSAESLYRELAESIPGANVALLHGRLRAKEKQSIIERFRSGEIQVLVSTTVIEVGVHVPQANIMVVESADRFGLAQLHQLRGRVGRGDRQAYCFLLADDPGEAALTRFRAMKETTDGFQIAEADLLQRGYGDLLGTRQHGDGEMQLLSSIKNVHLLKQAQEAAREIIAIPSAVNNQMIAHAKEKYLHQVGTIAMN